MTTLLFLYLLGMPCTAVATWDLDETGMSNATDWVYWSVWILLWPLAMATTAMVKLVQS